MDQVSLKSPFDFLPNDFLINEIISRVDVQSIVCLSMTSKKFYSLCSNSPVLQLKEIPKGIFFFDVIFYLDKLLEYRVNKKSNVKHDLRRILLYLPEERFPPIMAFIHIFLMDWFHNAMSLNVQEFITCFNGKPLRSRCLSERTELFLNRYSNPLKYLRVLTLNNIPIALNKSLEDWISICCVSLEVLNLSDVLVLPTTLTITSSSLRVFTIEGDFDKLNIVSTPKLVTLHVTWIRINLNKDVSYPSIKILDTPNIEDFLLETWDASYNSLRYDCFGDDINFPFLKSATVRLPEEVTPISSYSLKRLLLDVCQTRQLCVSDTILHQISRDGLIHCAALFDKLDEFHVWIERNENSMWWEKADTIISFVKSVPSLKTFKLTTKNDRYRSETSQEWLLNALFLNNVQDLHLQFEDNENMNNYDYLDVPDLQLPIIYRLKHHHLRALTLKDIPIGLNHKFEEWISTYCVNLQELNLMGVMVFPSELRITSSTLRVFTIDAHFSGIHISAPKLVTLHVTWNLVYHGTHETNLSLRVSEYSPHLENFLVSNWHTSLPLEYYGCCGDKSIFPSLKSATVLISNDISRHSFERLLLDISHTRKLSVSDAILDKISCCGILHSSKLHVRVNVVRDKGWFKRLIMRGIGIDISVYGRVINIMNEVPVLKTFTLTTENDFNDPEVHDRNTIRKMMVGKDFSNFRISRPIVYLDNDNVKVVLGPRDNKFNLLYYIIRKVPREIKFIFLYES